MARYNVLFLACVSISLIAMDNHKKNHVELKLVMSVDSNLVKIPFNDELETISTFIERYNQNDCHPFGKVMTYVLHEEKVREIGKIAQLNPNTLLSLPRRPMLFAAYQLNQNTDIVHMIFAGTSTIQYVNILRKFIEEGPTISKDIPLKSKQQVNADLEKMFDNAIPYYAINNSHKKS
jgi:hypothetical protein